MKIAQARLDSGVYVRKIGDVNECIVEGGEDTGNAKDELACENCQFIVLGCETFGFFCTYPHGHLGRGRCSPGLDGKPSLVAFWRQIWC